MRLSPLPLLLLVACGGAAEEDKTCDADTENCCEGELTDTTVDGFALQVTGTVDCAPRRVGQWSLFLDGVTATGAQGVETSATLDLALDLRPFDLGKGDHTLSLWAVPDLDVEFVELDSNTISLNPDRPDDTGDTGDTSDTALIDTGDSTTVDTGPHTVDLWLDRATLAATSGLPGDVVGLELSVTNLGTDAAGAIATAWWSDDATLDGADAALGTLELGAVSGGDARLGEMVIEIPRDARPGDHHVLVEVATDTPETDGANNAAGADFTVNGAQLEANTLNVAPAFGIPGDTLEVTWRARNTGAVDAGPVSLTLLWSDDALVDKSDRTLSTWTSSALTAYGSESGTTSITIPSVTSGFVLFSVDTEDVAPEAEEDDNLLSAPVTVTDVDLSPYITGLSDTSVSLGDRLDADLTLTNAGSDDASGFYVSLWLSADTVLDAGDTLLTSEDGGVVPAGTTTTLTVRGTIPDDAPVGGVNVFVVADSEGYVAETDESNNSDNLDLDVTGPDLVPDINGLSSTTLAVGASFTLDGLIRNWAAVGTSLELVAGLYLSSDDTWDTGDTLLTTFTLPKAGTWDVGTTVTASATIPTATAPGAQRILMVADPTDRVSEADESNNVDSISVTIY